MAFVIINIALQFNIKEGEKRSTRYIQLFQDAYKSNFVYQMNKTERICMSSLIESINEQKLPVLTGELIRGIFTSEEGVNTKSKEVEKMPDSIKDDLMHPKKASFYFFPHKHYCVVETKIPVRTLEHFFKEMLINHIIDGEELSVNIYPQQQSIDKIKKSEYFKKIKIVITPSNKDELEDKGAYLEEFLKDMNSNETSFEAKSQGRTPIPQSESLKVLTNIVEHGNGYIVAEITNEVGIKKEYIDTREKPYKISIKEEKKYERITFIESMLPKKKNIDE